MVGLGLGLWLWAATGVPVEHTPEEARRLVHRYVRAAKAAYGRKDYTEANVEWRRAYKLWPEPALLFNRGQALRLGNDPAGALEQYQAYLAALPQAPNRAEVLKFIAQLKKQAARPPNAAE
jgi:tetratricopeptide (TPR) repeat protein